MEYRMKSICGPAASEWESVITRNDKTDLWSKLPSAFYLQPFMFISKMEKKKKTKIQISHMSCNVLWRSPL